MPHACRHRIGRLLNSGILASPFLTSARGRHTIYMTMRYDWDEEKNRINEEKHQVAFEFARLIFEDPFVLFRKDRVDENGEQRWQAIGAVERSVLLVVHVYREENENGKDEIIRLISAREANNRERRNYIEQYAE